MEKPSIGFRKEDKILTYTTSGAKHRNPVWEEESVGIGWKVKDDNSAGGYLVMPLRALEELLPALVGIYIDRKKHYSGK